MSGVKVRVQLADSDTEQIAGEEPGESSQGSELGRDVGRPVVPGGQMLEVAAHASFPCKGRGAVSARNAPALSGFLDADQKWKGGLLSRVALEPTIDEGQGDAA